MRNRLDTEHLNIIGFRTILKLVLENNFFRFKNKFFRQILGIAMGSKCGPVVANTFLITYEQSWLSIHKPLVYARFIDDIFVVCNTDEQVVTLKNNFENLVLNIEEGQTVNFLDLNISIDQWTNRFHKYFFLLINLHPSKPLINAKLGFILGSKKPSLSFNSFYF